MKFSARIISPLEKVFYDDKLSAFPKYAASSALLGEKHSLSVAYRLDDTTESAYFDGGIFVKLTGDAAKGASVYTVEHVPAVFACPAYEKPDRYLRRAPGLYPDVLKPIDEKTSLVPVQNITHSLWIELDTDKMLSGDHTLIVSFYNAKGEALAKEKAWAFEDSGSYPNVPDGGSAGAGGGTPAADGVEAAFKGMNPGLNV